MTTPWTLEREEEIRRLDADATPGPWEPVMGAALWTGDQESPDETFFGQAILAGEEGTDVVFAITEPDLEPKEVDLKFAATSRTALPDALQVIGELRGALNFIRCGIVSLANSEEQWRRDETARQLREAIDEALRNAGVKP
jgi:hypothetical protein